MLKANVAAKPRHSSGPGAVQMFRYLPYRMGKTRKEGTVMCKSCGCMKGKYTESKDKKKDASMLKKAGLDKDEKKKFEKADKAHGKKKKPKKKKKVI